MKIVVFRGGLGNQIFEYAFYDYLKRKTKDDNVLAYYIKEKGGAHNTFEISEYFNIDIKFVFFFQELYFWFIKVIQKLFRKKVICDDINVDATKTCFDGWWQHKKFYENNRDFISYKNYQLTETNKHLLEMIKNTESVSIHIRRGDYLLPKYEHIYGNVCTLTYYNQAIDIAKKSFSNPHFFVFSNDMEWVKENFHLQNVIYVDNNKGDASFFDMYLMSHCKANIIANSSFSYWAAFFNKNAAFVTYPGKWYNSTYKAPDIFMKDWMNIQSS